ncbi:MAG: ion transporter [Flavobacteriales bacterium]|nr:ion transporter [Flavobacteriales bacterium]|tara:strand:+ start:125 stop:952 length:828 start_codon:yes stop_codon:yes gene_type:complete
MGMSIKKSFWRHRLHEIIYEADTKTGKAFDITLLFLIIVSVILVALESVESFRLNYSDFLNISEWIITIVFSIEYILRLMCVKKPFKFIISLYGIIDLLSIIPKYISILFFGTQYLGALRALRLLRVFRILKMTRYIGESNTLMKALIASRAKVGVFIFSVLVICIIFGTLMYMIEPDESGFTSIPEGIYWSIVTLTTVGYGDIAPITPFGQFLAAVIMIMGYGIIAVPTGIVTAELSEKSKISSNTQACPHCMTSDHPDNAIYCYHCGELLNDE